MLKNVLEEKEVEVREYVEDCSPSYEDPIGPIVCSESYGYGVVTEDNGNTITVRFDDCEETYSFPECFDPDRAYSDEDYLTTEDDTLLARLPQFDKRSFLMEWYSYIHETE